MKAIAVVLAVIAAAPALCAQQPPRPKATALLLGIVADTGKRPLVEAEIVAMRHKLTTITDSRGVFIFTRLDPGPEVFLVRHIGFRPESFDATLVPGDTLKVGVIMAEAPVQLPDLTVEAEGRLYFGKMLGFAERLRGSSGAPRSAFLTPADVDRLHPTRTIDLLIHAGLKPRYTARGEPTVTCPRGGGKLAVYLDGAWLQSSFSLSWLEPTQIQAVEVYRSAAERPPEFNATGSDCTVVIWTK